MITAFNIGFVCDACGYHTAHQIPETRLEQRTAFNFHCPGCRLQYSFAYSYSAPPANSALPTNEQSYNVYTPRNAVGTAFQDTSLERQQARQRAYANAFAQASSSQQVAGIDWAIPEHLDREQQELQSMYERAQKLMDYMNSPKEVEEKKKVEEFKKKERRKASLI
jgi:hypothetical protein